MIRYVASRVEGPSAFDQPPSECWPARIAASAASFLALSSSLAPMRSKRAIEPPESNAAPAPLPKVPSPFRIPTTWLIQAGKSGEGFFTASIPAAAMRISSNDLAFLEKNAVAFWIIASSAIFSSATAIKPEAVVPTSGLPPGVGAKPPSSALKHDLTYLIAPRTSGTEPPAYLSERMADEVEPRLDGPPALPANPPSGF